MAKIINSDGEFSFNPSFKRQKQQSSKAAKSFLKSLAKISSKSFGKPSGKGRNNFVKSPAQNSQRVVIKSRIVKQSQAGKTVGNINEHIKYVMRDGVEKSTESGLEISVTGAENVNDFIKNCESDRHHFRLILAPENSHNLDLKVYSQTLITALEKDLKTRLEFITVNHYNTDNPHTHLIIRGVDDKGKDLVISKEYMKEGMRFRAAEIATKMLGHRTELDIKNGMTREVSRAAFTLIDRDLLQISSKNEKKVIAVNSLGPVGSFKRNVQTQRLTELNKLSLAKEVSPGVWKVHEDLETKLRDLGTRGDIIKTMNKRLSNQHQQEKVIFDPSNPQQIKITGTVVDKSLSDEFNHKKYMVISATDNRLYYVPLSQYSERAGAESRLGSVVSITTNKADNQVLKSDENILSIADKNNGIYSAAEHLKSINPHKLPEGVTPQTVVDNHIKRLNSLESKGIVTKLENDTFKIPKDYREQIQNQRGNNNFVQVKLESLHDLKQQTDEKALTWIDKELTTHKPVPDGVVKNEFDKAKEARIETLCQLGLAEKTASGVTFSPDFEKQLYKMQMDEVGRRLPKEYGGIVAIEPDSGFTGKIKEIKQLPSGSHLVISDGKNCVVVPAKPGMERNLGKEVTVQNKNNQYEITAQKQKEKDKGMER